MEKADTVCWSKAEGRFCALADRRGEPLCSGPYCCEGFNWVGNGADATIKSTMAGDVKHQDQLKSFAR